MGYVSGEDGFTLIFKYDTEKNRIYFYSLTKLLEAEENKKTGKFLQLKSRGSNKDGQICGWKRNCQCCKELSKHLEILWIKAPWEA